MTRLRDRLSAGEPALGAWVSIPSPLIAEAMGVTGFDYVCLDCQHGVIGVDSLWPMLQVLARTLATPIVRVASHDTAAIGRALDAGAEGVIVPLVEDPESAVHLARACRYPPSGIRSGGGARKALLGGKTLAEENANVLCFVMIETADGVKNAEAIASVDGIDGVYIGPNDLAISLGVDADNARVDKTHRAAVDRVQEACQQAGRIAAIHAAGRPEDAAERLSAGFDMCTVTSDVALLREGARIELARGREMPLMRAAESSARPC